MAAKRRAPDGANRMKTFYVVLGVIALVGVAAIVYAARSNGGTMATEPIDLRNVGDASALLERAHGVSAGEENAPVQILVFSDYMCPACAHWGTNVEPMVKAEFVATGRARITFFDFPLGGNFRHSFVAARAARCAGDQDRFWEYNQRLLTNQQTMHAATSTPTGFFLDIANSLGLEQRTFESCLRSDAHAEVVTANRMLGETLGVGGTPTIFLNGRQLREWNNYGSVRAAIEAAGGA